MELLLIIELNRKPITILNSNNQMDRVIHHKEDQMVKCKVDRVINNKEEAVIKGIRCKEDLVDKEIKWMVNQISKEEMEVKEDKADKEEMEVKEDKEEKIKKCK